MTPHVRWMIHRDYAEVLEIERLSFGQPWAERDYVRRLRGKDGCIGLVAEAGVPVDKWTPILGSLVYALHKGHLEVIRLSVRPEQRRAGIGRSLLAHLQDRLREGGRDAITFAVPDTLLDAHRWLRACGYRVNAPIIRGRDAERDRYRFEYRLTGGGGTPAGLAPGPALLPYETAWSTARWRARTLDLVRGDYGWTDATEVVAATFRAARPKARCLPVPAYTSDEGAIRLVWSRRGRTIFLSCHGDRGASLTVRPLPMPPEIYGAANTPEALGYALDWAFGTGAPAPASPGEEDRSC